MLIPNWHAMLRLTGLRDIHSQMAKIGVQEAK